MILRPLPMLANPLPDNFTPIPMRYVAEKKYDGHRGLARVFEDEQNRKLVDTWSRTGKNCDAKFGPEIIAELKMLSPCILDGELVNLKDTRSYRVSHLQRLHFVVFDVLQILDHDMTGEPFKTRRQHLQEMLSCYPGLSRISLAEQWHINTRDALDHVVGQIWDARGEGVIVKDLTAPYLTGTARNRRSNHFYKLKKCCRETFTVMGFIAGTTEIDNNGPWATVAIKDDNDIYTVVKTLDDETLAAAENDFPGGGEDPRFVDFYLPSGKRRMMNNNHPWVGRRLMVEYHERTPDGSYRHPRWDRWEEE